MKEIYLDNSATTRIAPEVLARYNEVSETVYGNASSLHGCGLRAAHVLEEARASLRRALEAKDGTVVFTSCGSEANNLAILGRAYSKERYRRGARILTTAGEHASVGMPLAKLAGEGFEIVEIPTRGGLLDLEALEKALTPNTILVTMMLVNNESGALYDLKSAARLTHARAPEALFHVDATQAFMKVPLDTKRNGYDMVTVSAHKIEGPKGCGALWVCPDVLRKKGLSPLLLGGGQEGGLRSGTENVPGFAAFGTACDLGREQLAARAAHIASLRAALLNRLASDPALAPIRPNLPPVAAPHILSLTVPDIKSETVLHFLSQKGIYVSSGSACSSHGRHTASPLSAFGLPDREVDCTIRVSLSHRNTQEDITALGDALAEALASLAKMR